MSTTPTVSPEREPKSTTITIDSAAFKLFANLGNWLLGQQSNTVLLFLILGSIGWLGYYTIQTAIPSHLDIINNGFEKNASTLERSVDKQLQSFEKISERNATAFEKAIDRAYSICDDKKAMKASAILEKDGESSK